ncbi:MAG: O-antigen ligase family protein [Cyanobacteria bacterium P01_A01_bin.123]
MSTSPKILDQSDGKLLAIITAIAYIWLTLMPGSNTMVLLWPWVFVWQISLVMPVIWLLWQIWYQRPISALKLGHHLDILAGLLGIGIIISSLCSKFPQYSIWYGWATLCMLAALYAVKGWLNSPARRQWILMFQGYLAVCFIVLSLVLWLTQTYFPELDRLQALQIVGVEARFDFSTNSLRNWHPLGHPNYVAGYLVLVLPLLVGLGIQQQKRHRWFWFVATSLGSLCLYTTSSRGAWLALLVLGLVGAIIVAIYSKMPRHLLAVLSLSSVIVMITMALANSRFRPLILNLIQGKGSGELGYRIITNVAGWQMGIIYPLSGLGLGSVPQSYQQYRPFWAGREAEMVYQLHSTPAQLWAELGVWGVFIPLMGTFLIGRLSIQWIQEQRGVNQDNILIWSILAGLFSYLIFSLTDYQLDNICISGILLIYIAVLADEFKAQQFSQSMQFPHHLYFPTGHRYLVGIGAGITIAVGIWLIPIHRAWALSNYGFFELREGSTEAFVQVLSKVHSLVPWEVYYPYQLGWNLGDLSYQTQDLEEQEDLRRKAVEWLDIANKISPSHEFGHSNLGWLLINSNPKAATEEFIKSTRLVSAKQGVFFGLGFSLLQQGKTELAVEAMALELMRHPLTLTSPIWQLRQFRPIYSEILTKLEANYDDLLTQVSDLETDQLIYQLRGGLYWWQGDFEKADEDWQMENNDFCQILLAISQGQDINQEIDDLPVSPGTLALQAWLMPENREQLLRQAWLSRPEAIPQLGVESPTGDVVDQLTQTMSSAETFFQWLKMLAPNWQPRSQRLGFGVLMRHIDGSLPSDFLPRIENIPMTEFFDIVLPSPNYLPSWDIALQPLRQNLIDRVSFD